MTRLHSINPQINVFDSWRKTKILIYQYIQALPANKERQNFYRLKYQHRRKPNGHPVFTLISRTISLDFLLIFC